MSTEERKIPLYNQMLAETVKAGFLDQGFINTMRFSELNGPEEFDNTHLFIDWHALLEYGLQQLLEYRGWLLRQQEIQEIWSEVPEDQKKQIERWKKDIGQYDFEQPADNPENIRVFRNYLSKWNINIATAIYVYDGQTGILNGRMAKERGHKKEMLEATKTVMQHDAEAEAEEKRSLIDKLFNRK